MQDGPKLARAPNKQAADELCRKLVNSTVRDPLPCRQDVDELPVVDASAISLEMAAVMARMRSPLVAASSTTGQSCPRSGVLRSAMSSRNRKEVAHIAAMCSEHPDIPAGLHVPQAGRGRTHVLNREMLISQGTTAVVALDEESLRGGVNELRIRLGKLLTGGGGTLIVDLSRVERPSSTLLAALLRYQRSCQASGGRLVLRAPNRRYQELLRRTGLHKVFEVLPNHVEQPEQRRFADADASS